jgi:DNA-binding NtrC family response regulator
MKRVLVVDDDPHVSALAAKWLAAAGYDVQTADTFSDARTRIDEPLDLLVVDIRLRDFNGLQLAAHARATQPAIHIVVVSGWDDPVLTKDAEAFGAVFLPKPFDETQLVRAARGDSGGNPA